MDTISSKHEPSPERDRIDELLTRLYDGQLNSDDVEQLDRLIAASEEARRSYIYAVHLREGMRRWGRSRGKGDLKHILQLSSDGERCQEACNPNSAQGDSGAAGGLVAHEELSSVLPRAARRQHRNAYARRWLRINKKQIWGIAVVLLISVTCLNYLVRNGRREPIKTPEFIMGDLTLSQGLDSLVESETVVARMVALTSTVEWSGGGGPSDFLMRFRPGDVVGIEQGIVKIEFSDGAFVVLDSPTALQITGASSARLLNGRVVGRAENSNFALTTPTATIVDVGTEFGVSVGGNGTDVSVFEGEVQVHGLPFNTGRSAMYRLQAGMSARIALNGTRHSLPRDVDQRYPRELLESAPPRAKGDAISLLDLVGGHDFFQARIAGSIDPTTGYWGRPPWLAPERAAAQRGDTQFTSTPWNRMIDGVFIPRANAREMQIDSDGHMVYLPPNSGTTWGPIWARRRCDVDRANQSIDQNRQDAWGRGTLTAVHRCLERAKDGLVGLHANVGITFDLNSVRAVTPNAIECFRASVVNLAAEKDASVPSGTLLADVRIFVDGKLRFSRLEFSPSDGEASVTVPIGPEDRFLTIVATDADGDPELDHVVLIDPVLKLEKAQALTADSLHVQLPVGGSARAPHKISTM